MRVPTPEIGKLSCCSREAGFHSYQDIDEAGTMPTPKARAGMLRREFLSAFGAAWPAPPRNGPYQVLVRDWSQNYRLCRGEMTIP